MKKRIKLLIAGSIVAVLLSACSSQSRDAGGTTCKTEVPQPESSYITESETAKPDQSQGNPAVPDPHTDPEQYLKTIYVFLDSDETKSVLAQAGDVSTDAEAEEYVGKIDAFLAPEKEKGLIESYSHDIERRYVLIEFSGGATYFLRLGQFESGILGPSTPAAGNDTAKMSCTEQGSNTLKNRNMVIVTEFGEDSDEYVAGYEFLKKEYETNDNGGKCDIIYSAGIDDYRDLGDYGIIILGSHGCLADGSDMTILGTAEKRDIKNDLKHIDDLISKRVYWGNMGGDFALTPKFFSDNYPKGSLTDSVVFIGGCYGYSNDSLYTAFADAGVSAFIGYSNAVYARYNNEAVTSIFTNFLNGDTIEDAINNYSRSHGNNDVDAYAMHNMPADKSPSDAAYLEYGGNNLKIRLFSPGSINAEAMIINNLDYYNDEYESHLGSGSYANNCPEDERGEKHILSVPTYGIRFNEPQNGVNEAQLVFGESMNSSDIDRLLGKDILATGTLEKKYGDIDTEDSIFTDKEGRLHDYLLVNGQYIFNLESYEIK